MRQNRSEPEFQFKKCDKEDCSLAGNFPAPKDPKRLREYSWFCLAHVREYNLNWNYYKGMTQGEVDAHNRSDITWQRPTWAAKSSVLKRYPQQFEHYGFLFDDDAPKPVQTHNPEAIFFAKHSPEAKALKTFDLAQPVCLDVLKKCYKEMVKQYHPDKNKGCKQAEEKLKAINIAFAVVSKALRRK